jgi:hypothetical protein
MVAVVVAVVGTMVVVAYTVVAVAVVIVVGNVVANSVVDLIHAVVSHRSLAFLIFRCPPMT